jgi:hypothetical protein
MIWNRPSNLWLGALTALFNVLVLLLATQDIAVPPELVGAVNLAAAAVITLIAGQPPTVTTSDTVTVKTTNGSPDKRISFDDRGFATTTDITNTQPPLKK